MVRICYSCKKEKPTSEFARDNKRNSYQRECRECCHTRKTAWNHSTAGKRSSDNTKLKARFGITLVTKEEMMASCGNQCEICGATTSYQGHRLVIDHNHHTGKIRGILCKSCNLGIGNLKDDLSLVKKALVYLEERG